MKKTTRNYIRLLVANVLLFAVVVGMWEFRMRQPDAAESLAENPAAATAAAGEEERPQAPFDVPEKPWPLPDAIFMRDLKTKTSLTELTGQWTVLNLWASWCPPCIVEMPTLEKLAKLYENKNLQVIAITSDEGEKPKDIRALTDRLRFGPVTRHWDFKYDVFATLNPRSAPTTYIVDPQGQVRAVVTGERDWASPETLAYLDELMGRL